MSLLSKINGDFLQNLAERAGSSSTSTSSSNICGMGASTSFDKTVSGLSSGLELAAQYCASSYKRTGNAIALLNTTKDKLSSIKSVVSEAADIANKAADPQTSDSDRVELERQFSSLMSKYNKLFNNDEGTDGDPLDVSDIRDLIKDAGVDLNSATDISVAFNSVGGTDRTLGKEAILLDDQSSVYVDDLTIDNQQNATVTAKAISVLQRKINADSDGIDETYNELKGAYWFATLAGNSFTKAVDGDLTASSVEGLAASIVQDIKDSSIDKSLGAHSDLDRTLASQLLAY